MTGKHLPENIQDDRGTLARREAGLPQTRTRLARVTPDMLGALDKIEIEGLEVFANHGVYAEENKLGQKFVVSLTLYADLRRAGACLVGAKGGAGAARQLVDEHRA